MFVRLEMSEGSLLYFGETFALVEMALQVRFLI